MTNLGSKDVARAAVEMAISDSREQEKELRKYYVEKEIKTAAVDYGGDFVTSMNKITERAVVAAKREGVIKEVHADEGAVLGATREALSQIMNKAVGLNVGGKIGIACYKDHISVAAFFGLGLSYLDDVAIGIGHRAVSSG
ncbi:MAG: HutP family protein [Clostridiales bacterium]|nr:HutP family protein [Clostridiales bacterium]MCF8021252.1 HutP family protein [Clostridiales bacterium]